MMSTSPVPVLLVRLLARQPDGTHIGESLRVCHFVPVSLDDVKSLDKLTAYCGLKIEPDMAEVLEYLSGMPCEPCVAKTGLVPGLSKTSDLRVVNEIWGMRE